MIARFFIDRPVLAWVFAILVMLAGAIDLTRLPVEQYPDVAMPQISIYGTYPGASAKTVDQSVAQAVEREMNGLDHLIYMSSTSDSTGGYELTMSFESGTNPDTAQVQVQNRLSLLLSRLPEAVQREGLQVAKAVDNTFMTVAFYDETGRMKPHAVSDFVAGSLLETLKRIPGVGSTTLYGSENAMRIWLDPVKMRMHKLVPADVVQAVQAENALVSAGRIGDEPAPRGQQATLALTLPDRFKSIEEFENIRLLVDDNGEILRLDDVAQVESNSESFTGDSTFNGKPGVGVGLKLAAGANVVAVSEAVKTRLAEMAPYFPKGLRYAYAEDRAPVVVQSIWSTVRTLFEAVGLVVLVIFIFLRNGRATLIPTIAVPVVLLGVFALMLSAGFSINVLTMFAMVLAIGLLVDDAIVVVENTERIIVTERLPPRSAAIRSMTQITPALIGVAAVISSVFLPMMFMGGTLGVIFKQFAVTIVAAMILSMLLAIVLTPALCAKLLGRSSVVGAKNPANRWLQAFDRRLAALTTQFSHLVEAMIRRPKSSLAAAAAVYASCAVLYASLPSGFLPDEDAGMINVDVTLPAGASLERTENVLRRVEAVLAQEPAVDSVMSIRGWGFEGSGQNTAMTLAALKDWRLRGSSDSAQQLSERLSEEFSRIAEADIFVMLPPPILDLGVSGGFEFALVDRRGLGLEALTQAKDRLLEVLEQNPSLSSVRFSGQEDAETIRLDIDRDLAASMRLQPAQVHDAVSTYWAGSYVNDFDADGRNKKVYVQASPAARAGIDDIAQYYVRNDAAEMVPLSSFADIQSVLESPKLTRHQGLPSLSIQGDSAPGVSSGEAMRIVEETARQVVPDFEVAWTGLSYQEQASGQQTGALFALAVLMVFLCLAGLYGRWTIPFAVLLSAPMGIFGTLVGAHLLGLQNDIYFQIAVLTMIGLSAKNAVLIVEFAKSMHDKGMDLVDAALEASRLRFRPIVMTSLCFILGIVPLMFSSGASAGAQHALGAAIFCGMLSATTIGVLFTPLFFVVVVRATEKRRPQRKAAAQQMQPPAQ